MPVPVVVYTSPPLAEIGLTEQAARLRFGTGFSVLRAGYGETDWARTTRETYGVAKLVVDRNGTILGAGIAGSGASELVALFSLAIAQRLKVTDLAGFATASASLAQIANQLGATAQRLKGPPRWLASWQKLVRLIG